jgi:NitT/TauT family transport system substrate-binding protein
MSIHRHLATILFFGCLIAPQTGCSSSSERPNLSRIKMAYIGLTCEAPIFVAHDQGFYKEEGIEVELVKTDWDGLREGLGLGRFDANHTLLMYLLKPIEQGLDVKITGGIHTGCLRLQVAVKSGIQNA